MGPVLFSFFNSRLALLNELLVAYVETDFLVGLGLQGLGLSEGLSFWDYLPLPLQPRQTCGC
jgi:hypothetical protein